MVGLTLSAEQIRSAPQDVRRWLEQEIMRTLGLQPGHEFAAQAATPPLVGCNVEEARAILSLVQNMLPVVSVFFELGRETNSIPVRAMRAFRLSDILRGSRLHTPQQVIECLDILSQALRQVKGDSEAAFYGLDNQGHCLVAESTMRSILRLWQEIVAQHALQGDDQPAPVAEPHAEPPIPVTAPAQPYRIPGYTVTMPAAGQ
ncbi:MAG TPA: hypothetical protein VHX39_37505 [Acetobacteraceae bacterium]|jgi:hypothetical protein|nr:hypothetical protein [Acetobacteraceae bacterium]